MINEELNKVSIGLELDDQLDVQFDFFSDYIDFDQYLLDDNRPYSFEIQYEITGKKKIAFNDRVLGLSIFRFQNNNRDVLNILNNSESRLSYKNTSLYLKCEAKYLMENGGYSFGGDWNYDHQLEMSEVLSQIPKSLIIILEVYIYMVREAFLKLTFHSARGESSSLGSYFLRPISLC